MRLLIALAFLFTSPEVTFAQKANPSAEPDPAETEIEIAVISPVHEAMCQNFVSKIGRVPPSRTISFKPKTLPAGQEWRTGEIWSIMSGTLPVEVSANELPGSLRRLRGASALAIKRATCYLIDKRGYNTHAVTIRVDNQEEADEIVKALK